MTSIKKRASGASRRSRKRREEQQLDLDLAPRNDGLTRTTPDLTGKRRAEAKHETQSEPLSATQSNPRSETQSKRLRHGVLVQQFLR